MYQEEYTRWTDTILEDRDLSQELGLIADQPNEIQDRFASNLTFGTAGLRGVIGVGTNRMNIYTVRKATQGLANYLNNKHKNPSVAIAFDSRIKSELFAREAACILGGNGILVYLHPQLEPVPVLSFTVRNLSASAGIMITASHNPAKYNGYKVYGSDGCQLTDNDANAVFAEIESLDIFDDIKTISYASALENKMIHLLDDRVLEAFYHQVILQSVRSGICRKSALKLVYSPLNGAGNIPVRRIFTDIGLHDVHVVPEQEYPDGNFPTCPYPNPEIKEALALGLQLAKNIQADLMLATDPDADRVGIAVRDHLGNYHLLSGNEVGVLLLNYLAKSRLENGTLPLKPVLMKSIVSTPMADMVASKWGVEVIDVLTGFKYIGEQILLLEKKNELNRFLLGFEESYGYLIGTYVRDKDAVVASMLICEMAAYFQLSGSSIYEELQALYKEFGYYLCKVESFAFEGISGMKLLGDKMRFLRANPPISMANIPVTEHVDYLQNPSSQMAGNPSSSLELPTADVLRYTLENGSSVVVRPSGTEPKLKIYYSTTGSSQEVASEIYLALKTFMQSLLI